MLFRHSFAYPQVFGGQLWVERRNIRGNIDVLRFEYPLNAIAIPVAVLPLTWRSGGTCLGNTCNGGTNSGAPCISDRECDFDGFPMLGDATTLIFAAGADQLDFAVEPDNSRIWIADRWNSRVFRVADIDTANPVADVVLGQADAASVLCNRGGFPNAGTLCVPYDVSVDDAGNVYVADNGTEAGNMRRLLEFDTTSLTTFGVALFGPDATRVYGTGGDFDIDGLAAPNDPYISPFKPAFHPEGYLVLGNNPYVNTQRFPVVFVAPLDSQLPQLVLGDFTTYPSGSSAFDEAGNLYFTDSNWSRVLVYRKPLDKIGGPGITVPTRTLRPAGSATPTLTPGPSQTPTLVPLCAATPRAACAQPMVAESSQLAVKAGSSGISNSVKWKWKKGPAIALADLGDPLTGTDYALCVYDEIAGGAVLALQIDAPAAAICDGRPCWQATSSGFQYRDPLAASNGLRKLSIKAGADGRAAIKLIAKGGSVPLPISQSPGVRVQLVSSDGPCWDARYTAPALRNDTDRFTDRGP